MHSIRYLKTLILCVFLRRVWDKSLTLDIKSEQNELPDTQNSVLFDFLSNQSILKFIIKNSENQNLFVPASFQLIF